MFIDIILYKGIFCTRRRNIDKSLFSSLVCSLLALPYFAFNSRGRILGQTGCKFCFHLIARADGLKKLPTTCSPTDFFLYSSLIELSGRSCQQSRGKLACVAWRFWLGALSSKGRRGQRNREEIGAEATFSRLRRSCARLDKTAMLRRLAENRP